METPKFQNKYRIPSARAAWWDYANPGAYFITICTAQREHLFGEIKDKEMHFSAMGVIVQEEWERSFDIRKELYCDVWVIMPNHIHAIVRIEPDRRDARQCVSTNSSEESALDGNALPCVSTGTGVAYRSPKSVSSFVAGFKAVVTKRINDYRETPGAPVWQTRFHDRIIRNEKEYQLIYQYILHNIEQWEKDRFFSPLT